MYSIRRILTVILISCTVTAVLLSALFVNFTIDSTFNKYLAENQQKRNQRILDYFTEVYIQDKDWNESSGKEMQHEGYMSNYCLTLLDENKKVIWGMDPKEILNMNSSHFKAGEGIGEYITETLEIKYEGKTIGYIEIGQYQPLLLSEADAAFKSSINKNIGISVLITIGFCIIVSIIFSRKLSKPVKGVSETSVELSNGNYEAKSDTKTNVVEINSLIKSINILGDRLQHQDLLRKRLVTDITHEVRTPLNILQNNLEAMIDGIFPVTKERLIGLNDEVIRFGKLLSNLNSLKEIEEHHIELQFEDIKLDELVYNIYQDFEVAAKNKNIKYNFNYKENLDYTIYGDSDKIRQVLINILSNAFKFSKTNGEVFIELSAERNFITLMIEDKGIGIKKEDLPFVFERLYRGDKSRNEIEGSGIGLTIVKQIMLLHSAEIDVESIEGKGTCFKLRFHKSKGRTI